jgi:hypothetical protein
MYKRDSLFIQRGRDGTIAVIYFDVRNMITSARANVSNSFNKGMYITSVWLQNVLKMEETHCSVGDESYTMSFRISECSLLGYDAV